MANKLNLRNSPAIIVFLLTIPGLAQAATITVGPGTNYDFDTIQSGIDAAVDGDTVLVAPAEYIISEPITFRGKAIKVESEAGPDETTIRMGTPVDPKRSSVIIFENNETFDSVLGGFKITGGTGSSLDHPEWTGDGGGIAFLASSGTVKNCVIMQNQSEDSGGGVMVGFGSSANFTNCIIKGNSTVGYGAGLMCWNNSSISMTRCIIKGNSSTGNTPYVNGYGGGLYCGQNSSLTLDNCNIAENSAGVGGGGLLCWGRSSMTMTNCNVKSNIAYRWGGGVQCDSASATLTNCIIAQNSALSTGGGGVFCPYTDTFMTLRNCIIWGNSAPQTGGGIKCWQGSATVTNSIIWRNEAPRGPEISLELGGKLSITYSNLAGGQAGADIQSGCTLNWGDGNIDAYPYFVEPGHWADINDPNVTVEEDDPNAIWINGDYHLKSEGGRWDPNSESWVVDDVTSPCIDAGDPNSPVGDEPEPNGGRINMGAYGGTAEASMSLPIVYVQWLGHSSVKVWTDDCVVYVDPQNLGISPHDATVVCVTHTHGDHYSPSNIERVSDAQTQFIGPPDVVQRYGKGQIIAPGQTIEYDFVNIKAVPSYNTNKPNHPRSNNWVGYIIELAGKRVYVAGDTDLIEEMKSLGDIDVAFLPAGGTYTMNATEAAEATEYIKPDLAIPYHWGRNVGTLRDAETFAELARCPAMVMDVGETISSDNWPEYSPLIAHWTLDETEGDIAHDGVGEHHGILYGEPTWQPVSGKRDGALLLDGIIDYVITDFVLDPAKGSFSVFAWIKSDSPGGVVISQVDVTGSDEIWLGANPLLGQLMTGLVPPPAGRFVPQPLVSESIVTDGQWHHIGFAWDGSYRALYVDGTEVVKDTAVQNPLKSADGGMYIGANKNLDIGVFFSALVDDVRIYNVALTTEEIEELVR